MLRQCIMAQIVLIRNSHQISYSRLFINNVKLNVSKGGVCGFLLPSHADTLVSIKKTLG